MSIDNATALECDDFDSDHYYTPTQAEHESAVAQSMAEIRECGLIHCKSFDELNDHIDANELGGICEERFHWTIDAINRVQNAVDEKLKAGTN